MRPHYIIIRRSSGNLTGECKGCHWHVESIGADESSRHAIKRSYAAHLEEVKAA